MGNPTPHKARKRFGQNFLHDQAIISRIISVINPHADENIIEIGPGLGALTFPLLQHVSNLRAIELDRDLISHLQQKALNKGDLNLINADALTTDYSEFGKCQRIVGNLPYNISSPLLFHLLSYQSLIKDMHFMLQKEVVERMSAKPGNKTYGRMGVMIQAYCKVDKLFEVAPSAFAPAPAVDSAVVRLQPKLPSELKLFDHKAFSSLVKQAFAQRRKTLRNNLRSIMSEDTLIKHGISPGERAENLDVRQFIALSRELAL